MNSNEFFNLTFLFSFYGDTSGTPLYLSLWERMPLRSRSRRPSLGIYSYSMKLYEFLALSDELQFQMVWKGGTY